MGALGPFRIEWKMVEEHYPIRVFAFFSLSLTNTKVDRGTELSLANNLVDLTKVQISVSSSCDVIPECAHVSINGR